MSKEDNNDFEGWLPIENMNIGHRGKLVYRIGALFFAGVMLMAFLSGCSLFSKTYQVTYDWKAAYEGAKDAYRAGTKVKLTYSYIASDMDYRFTVTGADGTPIPQEMAYGGEIIFIMPEQDVKVETISRNSMTYRRTSYGIVRENI